MKNLKIDQRLVMLKLIFCLIMVSNFLMAQKWSGVTKIGLGEISDNAFIAASDTDKDGNSYVVGGYAGKLILGDEEYNAHNYLDNNFFIAKFDNTGKVLWSSEFHGLDSSVEMWVKSVFLDKVGNVYITGTFEKDIVFSSSVKLSLPDGIHEQGFICKYSPGGIATWAKFYYGMVTVTEQGKIFTEGSLHDGFSTALQWSKHLSLRNIDTLRCYNSFAGLEIEVKNLWKPNFYEDKHMMTQGNDVWFIGRYGNCLISKFDPSTSTFHDIASPEFYESVSSYELHDSSLYLLGYYAPLGTGRVQFGDITIEAKHPDTGFIQEGYLVKFNLITKKFEWGTSVENFNGDNGTRIKVSNKVVFVSSRQLGVYQPNYIHAFDTLGNLLWKVSSSSYIYDYVDLGTDQFGNLYVTGRTSSGGTTAYFGDYSFSYHYWVGFLTRVQVSPCAEAEVEVFGSEVSCCAGLLSWPVRSPVS